MAVFGESGSGKTVLLSSFYGPTVEPRFGKENSFRVVAEETGQGNRLRRNYLGMRDNAEAPAATRFSSTSYAFAVQPRASKNARAQKRKPFDAIRLVWHDYPGEWFETDVSGLEERQRKVETFRALLQSNVALLLVDGQRLLDNAGEEERYLKSMLGNMRTGLLSLKNDLLPTGERLVQFPRIWVIALSKTDLFPEMDVERFSDLMVAKATDEIDALREVIEEFVQVEDALSVGEDFLVLSSARFRPGKIEVTERVGVDLILPLATVLPLERFAHWGRSRILRGKVLEALIGGATPLALALAQRATLLPGPFGVAARAILASGAIEEATKLVGDKLREAHADAVARHDYVTATLTRFQMDLERGEDEQTLRRSLR